MTPIKVPKQRTEIRKRRKTHRNRWRVEVLKSTKTNKRSGHGQKIKKELENVVQGEDTNTVDMSC